MHLLLRSTLIVLGITFMVGCATDPATSQRSGNPSPEDPASRQTGGRWVTLPPETGSHISRRVWVNEDGSISSRPGESSVDNYDKSVMRDWQQRGAYHGRTGN